MVRRSLAVLAVSILAISASHASQGTPVLLSADRACSVKVDGEDVAILSDETPKKIFLTPGEHLFSAVAIDKATWKQVVTVGTDQKVVSIGFGKAADQKPAATTAPAATPSAAPRWQPPKVKARTGINEITRENGAWVVKGIEDDSPADKGGIKKGHVLLRADGEPLADKSYEQMQALDQGEADSTVTLEGLDKKGRQFRVTVSRQVLAADLPPPPTLPTSHVGSCSGIATACAARSSWTCGLGRGCSMVAGKCVGFAMCYGLDKLTCTLQPGCSFN
jgi:hypothetical protein